MGMRLNKIFDVVFEDYFFPVLALKSTSFYLLYNLTKGTTNCIVCLLSQSGYAIFCATNLVEEELCVRLFEFPDKV
jgi:hypothetical protein